MALNDPKRVIIALDYPNAEGAVAMAQQLDADRCRVKVGKELFTREGPVVVERLHQLGFEVFLDLKFHDIPNTVASACKVAAELGVWMVNVHASGGSRMMTAAREAVDGASHRPLLIGVSVLTSMSEQDLAEVGIDVSPAQQVERLAALAKRSGLDGMVCSAHEAGHIKSSLGEGFLTVTPGVRPAGSDAGDQRRVKTPAEALAGGADYLVIGRPVTKADDPMSALDAIQKEVEPYSH